MQPGANVGATHADFIKPGVIYGFRTLGDYGSFADGEGHIYYFGRSKQESFLELPAAGEDMQKDQKEMLKKKGRHVGLNAPSRMLLWARVNDIDKFWDEFREQLRGWLVPREEIDGVQPRITNQLCVGDNYYTVANVGPEDFGTWCRATMDRLVHPRVLVQPRVFRIDVEV